MEKSNVFLDTDVILNWLTKEVDLNIGFKLWKCPYEIMKLIENKEIIAYTSITNILHIVIYLKTFCYKKYNNNHRIIKRRGGDSNSRGEPNPTSFPGWIASICGK